MPYCSSCGNYYYEGTLTCNCGKSLKRKINISGVGDESKIAHVQKKDKLCPYCNGKGNIDGPVNGSVTVTCSVCKGRRYNLIPEDWQKCNECNGVGEFIYGMGIGKVRKPCPNCQGTGWKEEQEN
jgi:DnaJ-class molecular chaperone